MRNLKGIFSALLVSFNEDGSINEKGLREIIRYNIDKMKIDGLYVVGSQQRSTARLSVKNNTMRPYYTVVIPLKLLVL